MSVLVSGATGFIAQHIVEALLNENYKVIGTARSQEKGDNLKKQFNNNPNLIMEVVSDISNVNAFDHVLEKHAKDIKVVLHTASPFHFNTTEYEKDLLIPARNGTLGILEAIKKYASQTVERVVITSSFAAVYDVEAPPSKDLVYTEKNWNPATWETAQKNAVMAYCGSKKIAEKTAWDFLEKNKNVVKFQLSTVNPVFVFGPQLASSSVGDTLNTSCELINAVLKSKPSDVLATSIAGEFIDVRDVAKAHLAAFQRENTVGKRLVMSNGPFSSQTICNVIHKDFPQYDGKIAPVAKDTDVDNGNVSFVLDNSATKKLLGWEFISLQKSVDDTVAQIAQVKN
ncbi:hypothetical protein TBLA_0D00750 [Henningerozyma blattae CBS 6284]|uniref:NAD-dependent epimerase/dehydratase domain-containing protein n=1 Tax=Henningerozyma blattae (strain ATCC 34711 / CBS 6284 / DSM 70876 / NBRC 10599 / NRRL Y-10934 / UCD 77-7) TaxID=1071380 RepID=I2H2I1_HENB6|nr:hypothetical protein TBLA_0D00750 [Tetrapisispora blattae CBS 6284]CCH60583.1 hypothetical protein TBLA_0D00750 [Tetrapisispora blattae CBS 6284]